ncbi:Gas vesicle synthesis protein GvpL/GvpF [Frankia sp. QA3]|nr:Gas vesicle synthesis protein GvpL/GvpF [Frankia sp. QA3]
MIVYGITRADHPVPQPAPPGLGHPPQPVYLVRFGPLSAAVSCPADVGVLGDQEAVQHLDLLQRLLARGPVLPLRFGTVAPDEDAVRTEVLVPLVEVMPQRLDAVDGLVELRLDVDEEEQSALQAVLRGSPVADRPTPDALDERIRFGQEIAELIVQRRQQQAEEILSELQPLARSDQPRRRHGGAADPVLSWAFLLAADDVETFDAAVARLRRARPELAIEYVGPLPAIDFIEFPTGNRTSAGERADSFAGTGRWGWGSDSDEHKGDDQS